MRTNHVQLWIWGYSIIRIHYRDNVEIEKTLDGRPEVLAPLFVVNIRLCQQHLKPQYGDMREKYLGNGDAVLLE